MKKEKLTPGPWKVSDDNRVRRTIQSGSGRDTRDVCIIESWVTEPDAQVLAAARDMYELCVDLANGLCSIGTTRTRAACLVQNIKEATEREIAERERR